MENEPNISKENEPTKEKEGSPWGTLLWGLVLVVIAVIAFFAFSGLERDGGRVRIPALILIAYKLLGKWGVLGIFGGLGGLMTISGILGIAKKKS